MKPVNDRAVAVNVREAARCLGLGYVKTWNLVTTGELRSIRVGKRRLVPVVCLEEFVTRKLAAPSP